MERRQESHLCPGCACLCDDLDLTWEGGVLRTVNNVCLWGAAKFFGTKKFHAGRARSRVTAAQVRRRGVLEEASYEAALAQAAEVLSAARRPVVYGLTGAGSRAQEAALALARKLRARLEPADLALMAPYYQALAGHEIFLAPLEVIRDEADTVVYWGANPLHSCPRHLARYAVFARGRYTERGLEDRRLAAADLYRTELARFCQLFLKVVPGQETALLQAAAALVSGGGAPEEVRGAGKLAEFLSRGDWGVIFAGRGLSYAPGARERFAALAALVQALNRRGRFALFPLATDFNSAGLYHLLLTEWGSPLAPDFGAAGGLAWSAEPLDFREADAVLVTGADLFWLLPEEQRQDLQARQVPVVAVGPFADRTVSQAAVVLPAALAGVETEEIAYRMDGLPVALRPVLPAPAPGAWQVLQDLLGIL